MKLIRLKITEEDGFRSLQQGFEIYFLRDFDYKHAQEFNPSLLAGRNGSGKSNILEALANIFYHLDCIYANNLPDNFSKVTTKLQDEETAPKEYEGPEDNTEDYVFDNTVGVVDAYELEYFIPAEQALIDKKEQSVSLAHILITKEVGAKPKIKWLNRTEFSDNKDELSKKQIQLLLPKFVLGYSSGENELLSLPFFKTRFIHYDEYANKLVRDQSFGHPPESEGRLVYLDNQFSQAILLANLLIQDPEEPADTLAPLLENVELEDVDQFQLIICQDKFLELHEDILRDKGLSERDIEQKKHLIEITSNLDKSIEALKKCATCHDFQTLEPEDDEDAREYLILDYKVTKATKELFRFHFSDSPLQLFQLFQLLLGLNAYVVSEQDKRKVYRSKNVFINQDIYPNPLEENRILRFKNLWIKKRGLEKPLFTKELSDGEHQFLHSLGLCLLFRNENALFLLDEPETHFNPDWKAKFISNVRHCFTHAKSGIMRDMLITTHSPFLISDSEAKYVHVFSKDPKSKVVTCHFPDFQTLGSSVNRITIKIYNKPDTIGAYANSRIDELRKEFESAKDKEKVLKKVQSEIGDSVERVILINEILEKIEKK